ncbi:hypothetical protein B5C34_02200 [Pacificimonas flava]|uniref:Uncharacterized protein n=1 Tax=Pacificimonas flava TaxID=1234595 RepID=A0A219B215_9SPHN|nr:hypothetical protein B5C34_02200 [Pacificimonas flava]
MLLLPAAAAGQENLLPGFLEEEPEEPAQPIPATPVVPGQSEPPPAEDDPAGQGEDISAPAPLPPPLPEPTNRDDLATEAETADISLVGPLDTSRGGYGSGLFSGTNGALFAAWMRRIDTPLASRWAHIVLRRALLSRAPTPPGIRDADWVAARADLLVRMGEADGAKLLIANLPLDTYTPRLYGVAARVHLASADIPALCPMVATARAVSDDPFWDLSAAVCSGIEGDEVTAVSLFNQLRRQEAVPPIDLLLAERIASLAGGVNRAANVDWEDTEQLSPLRFGFAAAGGVEVPEEIWASAPPAIHGWAFRAPELSLEQRSASARRAAPYGMVSSRELSAIASVRADRLEASDDLPSELERLRAAYTGRTVAERLAAIETIVEDRAAEGQRFAGLLTAAPAAALIPPSSDYLEQAPLLIEALLASGRIAAARAWWPVVEAAEEGQQMRLWPLLVLADDENVVPLSPGLFRAAYRQLAEADEASARRRMKWTAAGLAGLGRIGGGQWDSVFEDFEVDSKRDAFTSALDRAAERGRVGEVAILSALGLQGPWAKARPRDLRPVLTALDEVGLSEEARLMAIEAVLRAP